MRLAVINDYQKLAAEAADWSSLPSDISVDITHDRMPGGDEGAARLAPYDIIVTAREETRFDRALIEKLPNLKLLVTHGRRNAALDMDALAERGIIVCGTGYGFSMGTVELAWGLILSLVKGIPMEDRGMHAGQWGLGLPSGLTDKTLGVLGLGDLGGGVARVGQAMGMDVIAWSQNLTEDRCAEMGVRRVDKDDLFRQSDILSIHVILSDRTRGLVGARELSLMKPTAYLVNTSRGPIVSETALIGALKAGTIAGAGLDVYDQEPLPSDHPLRDLSNTVLTPHIGGRTRENFIERYRNCLENVKAWLDGNPVRVLGTK
ncbi:MAG: D-2-hydroxyacid dehydrogenase family protein [Gammaproteobacteria bacterium]|jgi:phosphoglycerate dehydrogenase-like enzyme